jgi:hypothetical protein
VSATRCTILLLAAAGAALEAHAQGEITVFSARPETVAVTIYREDLALITETRTVTLPADPVTVVVQGVVESLLPQSVVITGAERPLDESNFDFDRLTPLSLLEESVGETVLLTRTNPATGSITRMPATILAVAEGVVLSLADGNEALYCSGLPERLEFEKLPESLVAEPQLSVRYAAGAAGERTLKVSYLAHGFEWSADYVARLSEASDRMELMGWVTLANYTGTTFAAAEVQVVAGDLNYVEAYEGGSRAPRDYYRSEGETALDARDRAERQQVEFGLALLKDCFEIPVPPEGPVVADYFRAFSPAMYARAAIAGNLEELVVTGSRIAVREELADYQLYRIPWATDLGARQTKQVAFLSKPRVRVDRYYNFRIEDLHVDPPDDAVAPSLILSWQNTERAGLGEPLPSGRVRVFEEYAGGEVFAGEAEMSDKPVGLPVDLEIGRALNLTLEASTEQSFEGGGRDFDAIAVMAEHRVMNNKGVPVEVEIRHGWSESFTDVEVRRSSARAGRKYGDYMWRLTVPANETRVLTYELEAIEPF